MPVEHFARAQFTRHMPWVGVWMLACGGPSVAESPKSEGAGNENSGGADTLLPVGGDPLGPSEPSESPPELGRCDEGQCFQCGDAICPQGFYCDEALAACGWLPACTANQLTCECLTKNLSQCSCTEQDGHLTVKCVRQE